MSAVGGQFIGKRGDWVSLYRMSEDVVGVDDAGFEKLHAKMESTRNMLPVVAFHLKVAFFSVLYNITYSCLMNCAIRIPRQAGWR